jgi:hypothetical protein
LDEGQDMAEELNYAPLPKDMQQMEKATIRQLQ